MLTGRKILAIVVLIACFGVPVFSQEEGEELRQWASSATATSEYSSDDYSAMQATGEPDTEDCADAGTAWASLERDSQETLTVFFDRPVYPLQVNIYQTFSPGAITGIELIPFGGGKNIVVRNSADKGTDCPGVFTVDINVELPLVYGVAIHLDQSKINNWNEIDAVELVGITDPAVTSADDEPGSTGGSTGSGGDDNPLAGLPAGRSVNCEDGGQFDNGQEIVVVQMRSESTYTITAVGLNDFDPILAVLTEAGTGLCSDDNADASYYSAYLPTSGQVDPSRYTAQVTFYNNLRADFSNISIVVGGRENMSGSFIVIVEGMTYSGSSDGVGDVFAVKMSAGMIASGVPLSVYQMSVTSVFDPLMAIIDSEYNYLRDSDKNYIACDNAGYDSCYGTSYSLVGSYVARTEGRYLEADEYDAMMSFTMDASNLDYYLYFAMLGNNSVGDYVAAFHLGVAQP